MVQWRREEAVAARLRRPCLPWGAGVRPGLVGRGGRPLAGQALGVRAAPCGDTESADGAAHQAMAGQVGRGGQARVTSAEVTVQVCLEALRARPPFLVGAALHGAVVGRRPALPETGGHGEGWVGGEEVCG